MISLRSPPCFGEGRCVVAPLCPVLELDVRVPDQVPVPDRVLFRAVSRYGCTSNPGS